MKLYQLLLIIIMFIPLFVIFINYLFEQISFVLLIRTDKNIDKNRKEDDI